MFESSDDVPNLTASRQTSAVAWSYRGFQWDNINISYLFFLSALFSDSVNC